MEGLNQESGEAASGQARAPFERVHWVLRYAAGHGEWNYYEGNDGDFSWWTPAREEAKAYYDRDKALRMLWALKKDYGEVSDDGSEPTAPDIAATLRLVRVTVRR